jgi:hypothetical protein
MYYLKWYDDFFDSWELEQFKNVESMMLYSQYLKQYNIVPQYGYSAALR